MRKLAMCFAALTLGAGPGPAWAEDDMQPSTDEQKSIAAALEALGCKGWDEIEKETKKDGSYHFEIDDAQCADGQHDIKLDKSYQVLSKSKD